MEDRTQICLRWENLVEKHETGRGPDLELHASVEFKEYPSGNEALIEELPTED